VARIRTIKPEFFTSEDIVSLSPFARLLYIALWCEADREGRFAWKPNTFKMRYLPGDTLDIDALARELVASGLVKLYGKSLAFIPEFSKHQHVNPREAASILPEPTENDENPRVSDASARDSDTQVGKERKGKEGDSDASKTRRSEVTFESWIKTVPEGTDAIPLTHHVFSYADGVGLPRDFLALAWAYFEKYYTAGNGKAKKYKSWPDHFRTAVEDGYGKLWGIGQDGSYYLTTAGKQLQIEVSK
jgi:hypothetical protein